MANFNKLSTDIKLDDLQYIEGSTPIKDYPDIQNANNDELKRMVQDLHALIDERDAYIVTLNRKIGTLERNLDAKYATWFDNKMAEFEAKMEDTLESTKRNLNKKMNGIDTRLTEVENRLNEQE